MSPTQTVQTADVQLGLIFERYVAYLHEKGSRPSTVINFVRAATPFQRWLDEQDVAPDDVTREHIAAYFHGADSPAMKYAASTRRMHAQQVRAAYSFAVDEDYLEKTPFTKRFSLPKVPQREIRTLSSAELVKARSYCRSWRHEVLFALLAYTGMRRDEIRRLTWEDIDWTEATMTFLGKGDKRRTVPLHPALKRVLAVAPAVGQITTQELKSGPVLWTSGTGGSTPGGHYAEKGDSFPKLLAPLTDEGFHIFRKTVATSLSRNGVEDSMILKILGWEAESMFGKHYYAPNASDMHRAILKLYADAPLKDAT